ncbi:regucalcin-like [Lytechinus pictus]|uniref:regucalcin-like n=1 Tax=Lytechinus pictus TaxID=7653 RepID=UPI0030B9E3AE
MAVEVVQKDTGYLLEGPHWDDVTNTLLYVDIFNKFVHSYNSVPKEAKKVEVRDAVGATVTTTSGRTMACVGREVGYINWDAGKFETFCEIDIKKGTRFNDCKCDPAGRFWLGNLINLSTIYQCNIFLLIHGVDAFDYNIETGEIANRRQAISVPKSDGVPDGMCIDDEGMLWVALFDGWAVNRYNPKTGEKLRSIKFPTKNITSCCWGGANRNEPYVTCAKHFLKPDELKEQDTAGSIFRVTDLGVKGVKCDVFKDN